MGQTYPDSSPDERRPIGCRACPTNRPKPLSGLTRTAFAGITSFGALLLLIVVLNLAVGFWIEAGPSERHRSTIDILMAVLRQPRHGYVRRGAFFAVTMGLALFGAVKLFHGFGADRIESPVPIV